MYKGSYWGLFLRLVENIILEILADFNSKLDFWKREFQEDLGSFSSRETTVEGCQKGVGDFAHLFAIPSLNYIQSFKFKSLLHHTFSLKNGNLSFYYEIGFIIFCIGFLKISDLTHVERSGWSEM